MTSTAVAIITFQMGMIAFIMAISFAAIISKLSNIDESIRDLTRYYVDRTKKDN